MKILAFIFSFAFLSIYSLRNLPKAETKNNPTAATQKIVLKLENGSHWKDISEGLPEKISTNCFIMDGNRLIIGTNKGVFTKNDQSNWRQDGLMSVKIDRFVKFGNSWAGLTYNEGAYQNMGSLLGWVSIFQGLKDKKIMTIFESKNGHQYVGSEMGIFVSEDKGNNWNHVFPDRFVYNILESKNVMLAISDKGIIRSIDQGKTWIEVLESNNLHNLTASNDVIFCSSNAGLYTSMDNGLTWKSANLNLGSVFEVERMEDILIIRCSGVQEGTFGPHTEFSSHIYYSLNNGKTWQNMDPNISIKKNLRQVIKHGNYFYCTHKDGISKTSDFGKSWELVLPNASEDKVYQLNIHCNDLYCIQVQGGC